MLTLNSKFLGLIFTNREGGVVSLVLPFVLSRFFFIIFRGFRPQKHIKKSKNLPFIILKVDRFVITASNYRGVNESRGLV